MLEVRSEQAETEGTVKAVFEHFTRMRGEETRLSLSSYMKENGIGAPTVQVSRLLKSSKRCSVC